MKYFRLIFLILIINCALQGNAQFNTNKPLEGEEFPDMAMGVGIGLESFHKYHANYKIYANYHIEDQWNFNLCISNLINRPFLNDFERMDNNRFNIELGAHYTLFKTTKEKSKISPLYHIPYEIIKYNELGIRGGFYNGTSYLSRVPVAINDTIWTDSYMFDIGGSLYSNNSVFIGFQKISNSNRISSIRSNLNKMFRRRRTYFDIMYSLGPKRHDFEFVYNYTDEYNNRILGAWNLENNSNLTYHPWGFRFGIEGYIMNTHSQNFYSKFEFGTKPGFTHNILPGFFMELTIGTVITNPN